MEQGSKVVFATVESNGTRNDRVASAIRFAAEASAAFAESGDQFERGMCEGTIYAIRALHGIVSAIYTGSHLTKVYTEDCTYTITYKQVEDAQGVASGKKLARAGA